MTNNQPECLICGGTGPGYEFPLWPHTPGAKFGEICAECDGRAGQRMPA